MALIDAVVLKELTKDMHGSCLQIFEGLLVVREDLKVAVITDPKLEDFANKEASEAALQHLPCVQNCHSKVIEVFLCARLLPKC